MLFSHVLPCVAASSTWLQMGWGILANVWASLGLPIMIVEAIQEGTDGSLWPLVLRVALSFGQITSQGAVQSGDKRNILPLMMEKANTSPKNQVSGNRRKFCSDISTLPRLEKEWGQHLGAAIVAALLKELMHSRQ